MFIQTVVKASTNKINDIHVQGKAYFQRNNIYNEKHTSIGTIYNEKHTSAEKIHNEKHTSGGNKFKIIQIMMAMNAHKIDKNRDRITADKIVSKVFNTICTLKLINYMYIF